MSYDSQTSTILINNLRKDVDALVLRIATLQDQKATGVDGGASVANTWTTRVLNAIHSDPYGIITSLSNNLFTVEAASTRSASSARSTAPLARARASGT